MKTSKSTRLGRLFPSIFILLFSSEGATQDTILQSTTDEVVIDSVLWITVHTACGDVSVQAKVDTGADGSSIDKALAERLCITEPYIGDTKNTKCPNGLVYVPPDECRPRVVFRFTAEGVYVEQRATLSDKSNDRYPILIGNRETKGRFLVRPIHETTTDNWSLDEYEREAEEEEEN